MPSLTPRSAPASPDNINLGAVGRGVARKLPVLLVLALLAGGTAAGVLSAMAPKYLSQAQLEVRGNAGSDAGGRPDKEAVGTHVRGLTSTGMALALSKALHLTERPEFNSALEPIDLYGRTLRSLGLGGPKASETDEDRLMQVYPQNVRAYQVRDTRSIIVDCTTSDAKFSAQCANTLAELYRDSLSGRAASENSDLRTKLKPQVERLTREAEIAEAAATEFRGKANLFQGATVAVQLKDQQLGELTAELTRISAARSDAEARATAARDMATRNMAAANPDVQKSTLVPRLEEQRVGLERQIAELSATLLAGHPRMKQLRSELNNLQGQIRAEVQKVVESLGNDARITAAREDGIRKRIDEMKRTLVTSAPDNARLAQLENDAKAKRAELERLQTQYEKAASTAGAGPGAVEIEIVSKAYPSNEKVFPKIGSMSAMTAFAVMILGLALTLTRELLRGARPAAPVRKATVTKYVDDTVQVPAPPAAAATVPDSTPGEPDSALPKPQTTAVSLIAMAQGARGYRMIVSGATPEIDGAAETLAFARALAACGQSTVLMAWNGAGNGLMRASGLSGASGTAQLLTGEASIEEVVQRLPDSKLDVITAGSGSAADVDGDSASMVLDALDELYDFIVICAPFKVAADLFASVQGRFEAGVLVTSAPLPPSRNGTVSFLGFDVADFPVLAIGAGQGASASAAAPRQPGAARRFQAGASG